MSCVGVVVQQFPGEEPSRSRRHNPVFGAQEDEWCRDFFCSTHHHAFQRLDFNISPSDSHETEGVCERHRSRENVLIDSQEVNIGGREFGLSGCLGNSEPGQFHEVVVIAGMLVEVEAIGLRCPVHLAPNPPRDQLLR